MSEPAPTPANSPGSKKPSIGRLIVIAILVCGTIGLIFWQLPPLGLVVAGAAVVAFFWTVFVTIKEARKGRLVGREEQFSVFAGTLGSAFVVIIASCVGFVATCFPIGFFAFDEQGTGNTLMKVAFGVGSITAILAGVFTAAYLRASRRAEATEKPPKKRRW